MPRQSGPKSNFRRKLLILNRMTALSRFAEPFQNLSNRFKIEIEADACRRGQRLVAAYFNTAAFVRPPAGQFGNVKVVLAARREDELTTGTVFCTRVTLTDARVSRGDRAYE